MSLELPDPRVSQHTVYTISILSTANASCASAVRPAHCAGKLPAAALQHYQLQTQTAIQPGTWCLPGKRPPLAELTTARLLSCPDAVGDKRSKDQGSKGQSLKGQISKATTSGKGKGALNTASRTGKKQPVIQPLGKAPTNKKEEAESVLWGVAVFGLFVTGELQ